MNIKSISVLGTGTMGHGIALFSSMAGLNVTMYGRSDASLKRGFSAIKEDLGRLESQGELDDGTCKSILDRIKGVKTIEEASKGTDFVIESLAEDLQIKRKVFLKSWMLFVNTMLFLLQTLQDLVLQK